HTPALCGVTCLVRQARRLFFFSSRRRHTRSKRDWSSDVCSSDLGTIACGEPLDPRGGIAHQGSEGHVVRERTVIEEQGDATAAEIGRASCRERVEIWVGGGAVDRN